ncbi:MAG: NADH-quinone oxidoreductase subunit L [Armatimonadetes bacterium]|nr:NADH-quinone oxidoreductase subunit L [Armatimonadota bacterium]
MAEFAWTIPLWPLLGWLLLGLGGGRLPRPGVSLIGCGSVALAFAAAVAARVTLPESGQTKVLFTWIAAGEFTVSAGLLLDALSVVMALVVTGVGLLIHIYSVGYMAEERAYSRYFAYLNLFVGSMLLLVLAKDLLVLFVGWELVGLCSYLLIGFWFDRERAAAAGRKAFLLNRIGDASFLLGMLVLWRGFGTLDIQTMLPRAGEALAGTVAAAAPLLLFLGATGKSAQLPLYTWLPDAMEGPTPVSALIHAATMVTAGVYMVARLFPLFAQPPTLAVIAGVGALTAFFAATIALVDWDLKRVLAYSTISQLGYMFLALGTAAPEAGIFHLVTHAFFKALLFLAAGSVMHAMHNVIDMRALGGLARPLRYTALAFIVGALALAGIPPLAGFVSKDLILERAWEHAAAGGSPLPFALGLLTAFVTAVYIARAARYTFFDRPTHVEGHPHEAPPVMRWPMALLTLLSVAGGLLGAQLAGAPLLEFLALSPAPQGAAEAGAGPGFLVPALSIAAGVGGLLIGWRAYRGRRDPNLGRLGRLFARHWYLLDLYDGLLVPAAKRTAHFLAGPVDLGVIDRVVNGTGALVAGGARGLRRLQTGYVRQYAAIILVGTVFILAFWMIR